MSGVDRTAHEVPHDPLLPGRDPMHLRAGIGAPAQNVRYFCRWPNGRRCVAGTGRRSSRCGSRAIRRGACVGMNKIKLLHRRTDLTVSEPALNDRNLESGLEEAGGLAMSQAVDPCLPAASGYLPASWWKCAPSCSTRECRHPGYGPARQGQTPHPDPTASHDPRDSNAVARKLSWAARLSQITATGIVRRRQRIDQRGSRPQAILCQTFVFRNLP